ncbi:hypothetical protein ABZ069_33295 [Streptomyces microflavus]|uniref:hypothetical protein n=1 Tax=Streptomyces microflavus TaxID=1919 RepID=UPI0033AB6033
MRYQPAAADPVQETPPAAAPAGYDHNARQQRSKPRGERNTALDSEPPLDWTDPHGIAAAIQEGCSSVVIEGSAQKLLSSL